MYTDYCCCPPRQLRSSALGAIHQEMTCPQTAEQVKDPPRTPRSKLYAHRLFQASNGKSLEMRCVNIPPLCTFELGNADPCLRRWYQVDSFCCLEQLLPCSLTYVHHLEPKPSERNSTSIMHFNTSSERRGVREITLCPPSHAIRRSKGE